MRVGFLNNQIDNRGTGNALFDYANYNETILGNESMIFTLDTQPRHEGMQKRLMDRFGDIVHYNYPPVLSLDVLYHIKSGANDGFHPNRLGKQTKYVVHSVFDNQPHGDVYAFVSDWLAARSGGISVPHVVSLDQTQLNLKEELGLRDDNFVFGRHGGSDSFDISFAWDAINEATLIDSNLFFVFLNTNKPDIDLKLEGKQIFFLPDTADKKRKRMFINTCDAMIHARRRGETFGISVGEFDVAGKGILTFGDSPERAHYEDAGLQYRYFDRHGLLAALLSRSWAKPLDQGFGNYRNYTPEKVMERFKEVFLDGSETVYDGPRSLANRLVR